MTTEQGMSVLCLLQQELKGFKIVEKKKSAFMIFLSWLPPFIFMRKKFMSAITTIGRTCYWPNMPPDWADPIDVALVYHEWMHAKVGADMGWFWYGCAYLFPQLLALLALTALPAIWFSNLWLIALAPLLALGPWPAHWRTKFEMQCTAAEMVVYNAIWGRINKSWFDERVNELFVSILYWFPCWSKTWARRRLKYFSKTPEAAHLPAWRKVRAILRGEMIIPMPPLHAN